VKKGNSVAFVIFTLSAEKCYAGHSLGRLLVFGRGSTTPETQVQRYLLPSLPLFSAQYPNQFISKYRLDLSKYILVQVLQQVKRNITSEQLER
jgi:hypothetical protein